MRQLVTFAKLALMPLVGVFTVIGFRNTTSLFPKGERSELR